MIERQVEVRLSDDGSTVSGTALVFNETSPTHRERFEAGSIEYSDPVLNLFHDVRKPVSTPESGLRFDDDGKQVSFRSPIPDTPIGDEARKYLKAGVCRMASIEFQPIQETLQNGIRVVTKAALTGLALVAKGSYPGSQLHRDVDGIYKPADMLWVDHTALGSPVEIRQERGLGGVIPFDEDIITSAVNKRKVRFTKDAVIDLSDEIYALDGLLFDARFATNINGGLIVKRVDAGIDVSFAPRKIGDLAGYDKVVSDARNSLTNGITLGVENADARVFVDDSGFTVQEIRSAKAGAICFVTRKSRGGRVESGTRRTRRRSWDGA